MKFDLHDKTTMEKTREKGERLKVTMRESVTFPKKKKHLHFRIIVFFFFFFVVSVKYSDNIKDVNKVHDTVYFSWCNQCEYILILT